MKQIIIVAIFFLFAPAAAWAETNFSLGGFVKLYSFWDSSQTANHMNTPIQRNNHLTFHHGRTVFTAQESRISFTVKGPKLWGAIISAFLEMDFDNPINNNISRTPSNSFIPQLRHAMFRLTWPETELLMGQYWSMFSEWFPEVAENGPFQGTGTFIARPAQIRLTQTILSDWTVAALICGATNACLPTNTTLPYGEGGNGQSAESPQVQAKIRYQRDLWGKAPSFGRPTPFTAQVVAGWQRNVIRSQSLGLQTLGQNAFVNFTGSVKHQYLNPWMVMGVVFIPVIPTHTLNMAGTASIQTQWWIGQGPEAFGAAGIVSSIYRFNNNLLGNNSFDVELQKRWGGYVQAQYYFTNQWFLTGAYGLSKTFGISQERDAFAPGNRVIAFSADQQKMWQQMAAVLWYRPLMSLKFGLEYAFEQTGWLQKLGNSVGQNGSDSGTHHRVGCVGFFFF